MKKSSRILAFVLTLLMVVSLMPVSALADELAPASAAESLLLPGMVDIPAIEETEEPVATETPAPTEAPAETEQPEATEAPVLPELDVVLPEVGSAADAVIGEAAETEEEAPAEAAEAAEDGATTLVAAASFASDIHGSTSDAKSVYTGVATSGLTFDVVGFVGDTFSDTSSNSSTVTSVVTSALDSYAAEAMEVLYSFGDHDSKSDIADYTGLLYGDGEGEEFYVYAISMESMDDDSDISADDVAADLAAFTSNVATYDKSKPMFIMSHMPLHARRGDNIYAYKWYEVINAAAQTMDITFFWAHNHTSESTADTNAYYIAKGGTLNVEQGSSSVSTYAGPGSSSSANGTDVTIDFTYMNAGYINANNQDPARIGVATTVAIYEDELVFQDYNSSGTYTDSSYSHNVSVTRSYNTSASKTFDYITVTEPACLMFKTGETFTYDDMVVKATYSDSSIETITDYSITSPDMNTPGIKDVTVSYSDDEYTFQIVVADEIALTDVEFSQLSDIESIYDVPVIITYTAAGVSALSMDFEVSGTMATVWDTVSSGDERVTISKDGTTVTLTAADDYGTASRIYTFSDGTLEENTSGTINTVTGFIYGEEEDGVQNSLGSIQATATGLTGITAEVNAADAIDTALCEVYFDYDYVYFDVSLAGHTDGNEVFYSVAVMDDVDTTNLEVYYVNEDNTLVQIPCTVVTDEQGNKYVEFTTTYVGTFAYGAAAVPDGYALDKIEISNVVTTRYFVNDNLDLYNPILTATYTMDGAEDFVRLVNIAYEDVTIACDMTVVGKQTVTLDFQGKTDSFDIEVFNKEFTVEGVSVEVNVPGATELTVAPSANANVAEAIQYVIEDGTYVAYDIELAGYTDGETVTVTLPLPEGLTNPVVYYVSDDGKTVTNMNATKGEGVVSFTTDHFSTYVLGDGTTIELESGNATVEGSSTTTTEEKTVYVKVDAPVDGEEYLIVSTGTAGTAGYILGGSSVTPVSGTLTVDGTDGTYTYIETTGTLWTASGSGSSWSFKNTDNTYLGYTTSSPWGQTTYTFTATDDTERTWTLSNNNLYFTTTSWGSTYYRYISGGESWSIQYNRNSEPDSANIYFYKEVTATITTTTGDVGHTYSTVGTDITDAVAIAGQTVTLSSVLYDTPEGGTATDITADNNWTATYEVVTTKGNPNVIAKNEDGTYAIDGATATLSGTAGTAVVKVTYTYGDLVAWDEFVVTAAAPDHYSIELHKATLTEVSIAEFAEGVTYYTYNSTTGTYDVATKYVEGTTYYTTPVIQGDEITETIALKGIEAGDTYSVWAVVKAYATADSEEGIDLGSLGDALHWTVSDTSIATIDTATGVLTFTGENYGTFTVTVSYEGADGKVITDTITISATESLYIVPGDGTNDFPEYPNEGAVRFDKTATAVGNYSETGIAMVELSMTGVNYNKGSEIDVVVMLDMSTSMDDDRIAATVAATKTFIDSIVKNEDGSYNANRVYVGYFNGDTVYTITDSGNIGGELASVDNDTEYNALIAAIEDEYDGALTASGTNYDVSLEECYNVLTAAKTDGIGNDRQQFVVFMSDGGPTDYATSASNVVSESTVVDWFSVSASDSANWTNSMVAEYWSGLMKTNGVTIYSVGLLLNVQPTSGPQDYRDYSADQNYYVTSTLLTGIASGADYFINCESATDTDEMEGIFENIAKKIMKAATNVVVEDKIGSNYTMNFSIPGYGTDYAVTDALEGTTEFYIQVVEYTLDEDKNRSGDPDVLENFTFKADGTLKSHTVDGAACGDTCSHVTFTDGVVTAIDGTYFDYKSDSTGEYLTWKTAELTDTELALQYFAYLDNSTGVSADEQIKAGTYYTNEYATLTYTNYLENEVQQKFPVPQMTWNGAQVSYTFYLVNDAGQPVNRAGRVVPFAEAVYVTDVFTYSIVWNDLEQSAGLDAEYLAQNLVPDVYALYDDDATYNIHVYEDEDKSNLNNHFVIGGDVTDNYNIVTNSWTNASTTYVFNNKSDAEKYHTVGAYIANDGKDGTTTTTYLCKGDGTVSGVQFSEATVTSETDLLNGVYYTLVDGVYTRAITYSEDATYYTLTAASYTAADGETQVPAANMASTTGGTQIGDYIYYVDENGDVYTIVQKTDGTEVREGFDFSNTTVAFAVVWKPELRPDTVVIDYGLPVDIDVIATDSMAAGVVGVRDAAPSGVNEDGTYTRDEDETLTEVGLTHGSARVKNNTVVTYTPNTMTMSAPEVFYYEADVNFYDKNNEFQSTSMYSTVTVVPATTIYYEDSFVTFNNGTGGSTGTWSAETTQSGTQALDRPGPDKYGMMNGMYQDADNVYGYDSAYDNMATYSMGSARYVTVSADNNPSKGGTWPTAEFTFTGTGFDIISMTDNTTGTIFVDVYAGTDTTGDAAYNWVVDTYYGYTRKEDGWLKHTWTYYADGWHVSTEEVEAKGGDGVETLPESPEVGQSCVIYEKNYIWTVTEGDNALYQIPVIKSPEMTYGTYTVVITPMYAAFFDHAGDDSYNFYLDAIRIYNPTGDLDNDTLDVYKQDEEAYPTFVELRNNLLTAGTFDAIKDEDDEVTGVVFIDGVGNTAEVADYAAYGPNNEVYLASNQAIAFSVSAAGSPEKVMLGVKSLDDAPATITISRVNAAGEKAATKNITVNTATDMYYDISDIVLEEVTEDESYNIVGEGVIVIQNSGDNLVSLTNIKTTFNAAPVETTGFNLLMSRSYADVATAYIAETTTDAVVDGNTSTGDDVTDDTTGTEGAPGDEESGGDAGDDTGKNIRDTLQNAVSVINRQLEAAAKNIRRAVSGLLARLGR